MTLVLLFPLRTAFPHIVKECFSSGAPQAGAKGMDTFVKKKKENIVKGLKGYCTVFHHALKLLDVTGIVLT